MCLDYFFPPHYHHRYKCSWYKYSVQLLQYFSWIVSFPPTSTAARCLLMASSPSQLQNDCGLLFPLPLTQLQDVCGLLLTLPLPQLQYVFGLPLSHRIKILYLQYALTLQLPNIIGANGVRAHARCACEGRPSGH